MNDFRLQIFDQVQYCCYLVKVVPSLAYFLQLPILAAVVTAVVTVLLAAVAAAGMATVLVVL